MRLDGPETAATSVAGHDLVRADRNIREEFGRLVFQWRSLAPGDTIELDF